LEGDIAYQFPAETILPANAFLVIAKDVPALRAAYAITNVLGPHLGLLPNGNGMVRLLNPRGAILLEVSYLDEAPWPVAADGAGPSLVLSQFSLGERNPRSWRASARIGASPGANEPVTEDPLTALVINEVLASSGPESENFVEPMANGPIELDVSGCFLTENFSTPGYKIPIGTMMRPGGFFAITQGQLGFTLSASGGSLLLYDPARSVVLDALKFGPQAAGLSVGRFPNGGREFRVLAEATPGGSNERWFIPDAAINEIMYNPISGDSDDEYVELHNHAAA
jgi:hypothetical protein